MARYVAFLRAINVGGHVVKMEPLRKLFAELELANVETFIASGNVIFETRARKADALEAQIERHLRKALGYEVKTFLRSDTELEAIAGYRAFPAAETEKENASVYIALLAAKPALAVSAKLIGYRGGADVFKVRGRDIYWLCRARFSDSEFSGPKLEKLLGVPTTARNMNTIRKLTAKYPPTL